MRILHISNGFSGSKVHQLLYRNLERRGVSQVIYVPINYRNRRKKLSKIQFDKSEVVTSSPQKIQHMLCYKRKIKYLLKNILDKNINYSLISVIHASTWCVDGAIAFELYKLFKVPYIITVRNTDINIYYKYYKFCHPYFYEILENASKIVFVSAQYEHFFINNVLPKRSASHISNRVILINNGIDDYFLKNIKTKNLYTYPIKLLFIGGFNKNKNIHSVIKAVESLRKKGLDITFTAVGADAYSSSPYQLKIERLTKKYSWFYVYEKMPKEELLSFMNNYDIFIMTSFRETFGLVYVEALSQGLPIIYTAGQGFDKFYAEGYVGHSVNPRDTFSIIGSIEKTINEYSRLLKNISSLSFAHFSWDEIAKKYIDIYDEIIKL